MADSQNSSFIPKAPKAKDTSSGRGRKVYILSYVSFVLFFGALIATGIVFFLAYQQDRSLALEQDRLQQEQAKFNDSELVGIQELASRLSAAEALLERHVSPVSILQSLEFTLLKSVTVTNFVYSKSEDGAYTVEISAEAPQFNAALFQREILSGNPILANADLTEVTYGTVMSEEGELNTEASNDFVSFKVVKNLTVEDIPHEANPPFSLDNAGSSDVGEDEEVSLDDFLLPTDAQTEGGDTDSTASDDSSTNEENTEPSTGEATQAGDDEVSNQTQ